MTLIVDGYTIDWYTLVLAITGAVYLVGVLWLVVGLGRQKPTINGRLPRVSIIVAARNEEAHLGACLQALKGQEYAGEWEVVVVDDRSEDGTGDIIKKAATAWPRLKMLRLDDPGAFRCPKKNALAAAINLSVGELLLFTDADCQPDTGWLASTVRAFDAKTGLVAGFARPASVVGIRRRLLALDNLAVAALAAGSMTMGAALACTGRNLAYRRQVYDAVGGFAPIGHLVGGDDVYFMRLVAATSWKMVYNRSKDGAVACDSGPDTWAETLQQKLRHAAKAGHYSGPAMLLAGAVYLFHLLLMIGLLQMLAGGAITLWFWSIWGLRWLVDFVLMWLFSAKWADRRLLSFLPLLEVCYIPYVVFFTVLGRLGWFRWKA
jgi:biofilm PGA synthesis N-glycosyltransferase PgaC